MKRLVLGLITLCLLSFPGFGEPSVARFLSLTEGFAFDPVSETPDVSDASRQSELDEDLLDEAGLLSLSVWRTTSGEPTLEVQVYETADSRGAYQLYSWWKLAGTQPTASVESLPVGNAVGAGEGLFWRSNYMLRVSGPDTAEFAPVFTRFVEAFARTIPLDNFLPVSVTHLPDDGLDRDSVRFYLGPETLRKNPDFPAGLIGRIGFEHRAEVAFGRYGDKPLFLIGYPTVAMAKEYEGRLAVVLGSAGDPRGFTLRRSGILLGLARAENGQFPSLLAGLQYKPRVQWLRDRRLSQTRQERMTFFGLLTQTFLGIGFLLLMVLAIGGFAGLTRYELLRRFPWLYPERIDLNLRPK